MTENRDTHLHDSEIRQMAKSEMVRLQALLPDWITQSYI